MVNGQEVTTGADGGIPNTTLGAFKNFYSFTLNSSNTDFVSGINTIEFVVYNNTTGSPNVTGLNVDIETTFADPTPEPGTFALVGLGLCAVVARARKSSRRR